MKKIAYKIALLTVVAGVFTMSSCKDEPKPTPEVEQEEYDAVRVQFIELNSDGSETTDTTTINFDKTGAPTPLQSNLQSGEKYRTLITMLSNGESINQEIMDEGTEHKFFFIPSIAAGITNYVYNDPDVDGNGIGLDGTATIGAGQFSLKIVLRHALDKSLAEAQAWNSTNYQAAGGTDDLNIEFNINAE